jgi:hypothetical protein
MISTTAKLALAFAVIGAAAFSMPSAEARSARTKSVATHVHRGSASDAAYVRQQSFRGSYNLAAPPAVSGGGINFNDGRFGANYNPNQ